MGEAARRRIYWAHQAGLYELSLTGIRCLNGCVSPDLHGIVDLATAIPPFAEPGMPPGPRYLCAICHGEFDE